MPATRPQLSNDKAPRLRRTLALAALLGLALFQVSLASHQYQHQGSEFLDVCGICMQLDRMDGFLSPDEPILYAAPVSVPSDNDTQLAAPSRHAPAYQSRAPPTV
ncbi:MAG TPA: hypothetical protein VGA68_01650 [Woeseiaceae bacterium]|jgi:hypothetical protein